MDVAIAIVGQAIIDGWTAVTIAGITGITCTSGCSGSGRGTSGMNVAITIVG
jgi:hypothetical protein